MAATDVGKTVGTVADALTILLAQRNTLPKETKSELERIEQQLWFLHKALRHLWEGGIEECDVNAMSDILRDLSLDVGKLICADDEPEQEEAANG